MKSFRNIVTLIAAVCIASSVVGQCDTIASLCSAHFPPEYISDGQQYRCLLLDDETAEFHATLFGGSKYRIASCSGMTDGNLIFRLLDEERNLLYNSADYKNAPYWDFEVESTLNCIIEAQLDPTGTGSGCAVLLIGFKQ